MTPAGLPISRRGADHGVTGGPLRALGTVLPTGQIMGPFPPGAIFIFTPMAIIRSAVPLRDLKMLASSLLHPTAVELPIEISTSLWKNGSAR